VASQHNSAQIKPYLSVSGDLLIHALNLQNMSLQTRGLPRCIMWSSATFVNYGYTIKITQLYRQLVISLIVNLPRDAGEPDQYNECGPWP
jgi:hypothetical protein